MVRQPHKENCQCVVCKSVRAKVAREVAVPIIAEAVVAPNPTVQLLVKTIGVGTPFRLSGKEYRLDKVDLYPAGQAIITSLESGKESSISNQTMVSINY